MPTPTSPEKKNEMLESSKSIPQEKPETHVEPCPSIKDYWVIEPHINPHYDRACIPVDRDPETREALRLAQDTLEMLWDSGDLEELDIKVSIKRETKSEEDILDDE